MNSETSRWIEETDKEALKAEVKTSISDGRVWLALGWPHHTTFFFTEEALNTLIDNIVKAREEYFRDKK